MTRRAIRTGTFGVVVAIAAVWLLPWIRVAGSDPVVLHDGGLEAVVLMTLPLLVVLDAIHRNDRTIAAIFLLPMVAFSLWIVFAVRTYPLDDPTTAAHPHAGVVAALLGCGLTYASFFMRRARKATPPPEPRAKSGVDVIA